MKKVKCQLYMNNMKSKIIKGLMETLSNGCECEERLQFGSRDSGLHTHSISIILTCKQVVAQRCNRLLSALNNLLNFHSNFLPHERSRLLYVAVQSSTVPNIV